MKKFFLLVTFVICCLLFGCSDDNIIEYDVISFECCKDDVEVKEYREIVRTYEELEELKIDCGLNSYFSEITEDYFDENSLLVYIFLNSGLQMEIESVLLDSNNIIINISTQKKLIYTDSAAVLVDWICIIQINSKDVNNVDNLVINHEVKTVLW